MRFTYLKMKYDQKNIYIYTKHITGDNRLE